MPSFHDGMEFVTDNNLRAAEYGDQDLMAERFDSPTSIFDSFLHKLDHPSAFADVGPTSEIWGPYPSSHFAPSTSGPSILDETLYHPHNPTSPAFDSGAGGNGRHHGQPSARPQAPTTSSSVPPSSEARQSELQSSLSQVTTESWVFSASGTTVAGGQTSADGGRPHYSPLQDDEYVPPRVRGNNRKPRLPQSSPAADGFGSSGAHPVYPAALHPSGSLHSPLSNSLTDFTTEGSLVASEAAADASLPQTKKRRRDIDNKENDIAHLAKKVRHARHARPHPFDGGECPATDRAPASSANHVVEQESLSRAMAILNSMSTSSHTSHWEEKPSSAGAAVGSLDESSQVYEHRAYGWLLPYENGVSSNEHLQESITNSYASPAWPSDNNSELNQAIASQDLVLHANALDVTGNDLGAGGEDHTGDLGAFYDVPESMPYTYPPPPPFLLTHGSESSLAAPAPVVSSTQHKPSSQTSPPAVVAPHDIHPGRNSAYTDFDLSVDEDNPSTAETPASQSQVLSTPPPLPAASHAHARATETPGPGAHQNGVRLVPQAPDCALSPQQLPALPSTTPPVITFANAWDPATQGAYPESNHPRTAERVRRRWATARVRTNPYPRSQHAARDGLPPSSSEAEKPESSSQGARRQAKSERASDSGGSFACPICGKHLQRRGDLPRHALWVGDHLDIKQMCVAQYHRDPCPVTRRDGAKRHWASAKCMGEEEFNRQYKKLDGEFGRLGLGESSASRKGRIMRRIGKQYLVVQVPCWKKHPKGKELPALLQLLKPEGHNELDRIRLLEEELREHGRVVHTCKCCRPSGYAHSAGEGVSSTTPRKKRARVRDVPGKSFAEGGSESDPGPESEEDTPLPTYMEIGTHHDSGRESSPDVPLRLTRKPRRKAGKTTRSDCSNSTRTVSAIAIASASIPTTASGSVIEEPARFPPSPRGVATPATVPAAAARESYRPIEESPSTLRPPFADGSRSMFSDIEVLWNLLLPPTGDANELERLYP